MLGMRIRPLGGTLGKLQKQ